MIADENSQVNWTNKPPECEIMVLRVLVYVRIYQHKHWKVELVVLNNIVVPNLYWLK